MMAHWICLLEPVYRPFLLGAVFLVWGILMLRLWKSAAARKVLRMFLLSMAMICLFFVGLRPTYLMEEASVDVIYLSKNYQETTRDSLQKRFPKARIYAEEKLAGIPQSDIPILLEETPQLASLHILGDGVSKEELAFLSEREVYFYLNRPPSGIQSLAYQQVLQEGQDLLVNGIFHKTKEEETRLTLFGPTGKLEGKVLRKTGGHSFQFLVENQRPGRFLYTIKATTGSEITEEKFPVLIRPNADYSMLILQSAPSFETKYLKNLLVADGRELAMRSTVSKGKFKKEFINQKEIDLEKITRSLLSKFQVVLVDEALLKNLEASEISALKTAINNGLGLLVLPNSSQGNQQTVSSFSLSPTGKKTAEWANIAEGIALKTLPLAIRSQAGKRPIIVSKDGRTLAAYQSKGAGRIVFSLLQETYSLQLSGKKDAYRQIWMQLLDACLAPDWLANDWVLNDPLAVFPNKAVAIDLVTSEKMPTIRFQKAEGEVQKCPPAQHQNLQEMWSSYAWPKEEGWHFFNTTKHPEAKKWLYVQADSAWGTLVRSREIERNERWVQAYSPSKIISPKLARNLAWPVPLWWFYVGFLFFAGGIWLMEKME